MDVVLHPVITLNVNKKAISGNLRFEFVCNSHFYNIGIWLQTMSMESF